MSFSLGAVQDGRALASRLLPGSRIIVRFANDTTWWHERLVLYPVSGPLFVILTGGDDLYVESAADWIKAIDVTGKETYPLGLKGGLVHFDVALDDEEVHKHIVEGRGCAILEVAADDSLVAARTPTVWLDWLGHSHPLAGIGLGGSMRVRIRGKRAGRRVDFVADNVELPLVAVGDASGPHWPAVGPAANDAALRRANEDSGFEEKLFGDQGEGSRERREALVAPRYGAPDGSGWFVVDLGTECSDVFGKEVVLGGKSIVVGRKAIHLDDAGKAMHCELLELGQLAAYFEGASTRIRPTRAASAGGDLCGGAAGDDLHAIYGAGKAGGASPLADEGAVADAEDDDRTLWVDVDTHGERYKSWRDVTRESSERVWGKEWTFPGPPTVMHLVKRFDRAGGDPRQWFLLWCREKNIGSTDRTFFEVETLVDYFYYSGCVDQVNLGALVGAEVVSRRLQQYVDAYAAGGDRPNWDSASLMTHAESVTDIVSPGLRLHVSQRARDQANLQLLRNRSRALVAGQPYVEDAMKDGVLPAPRPAAKPPPKKKGPKGVGKAGAGEAQ